MNSGEDEKLEAKKRYFDEVYSPVERSIRGFNKEVVKIFRSITNFMMYSKKPTNKGERFAHALEWWFYIGIIFFALKGFTYWLTGR